MLVTSRESITSNLWLGFFDFDEDPWTLPLPSLCLASRSLWRRSFRRRSTSGSCSFPDLSTREESELRLSRRGFASGGSAKMSSPCGAVDFPPFNCLRFSSSLDRDGRCPTRPFLAFADGGIFSGRSGRVEFGGAIAERGLSLLGLSSRDKLFFRAFISNSSLSQSLKG